MTDDERADLEQAYLLALLTRDAKIWREHQTKQKMMCGPSRNDDEQLSSSQASKPVKLPHVPAQTYHGDPCRTCGGTERYLGGRYCVACHRLSVKRSRKKASALSETEKQKRRDAWTLEKREAQRQRTAAHGENNGHYGKMGGKKPAIVSDHAVVSDRATASAARAAAKAAGQKIFMRGRPCKKCGCNTFYVGNCSCTACSGGRYIKIVKGAESATGALSAIN
jgi:hypothetical protein